MQTGAYISGAGHLILILWVILGGVLFRAEKAPTVETSDVTLLSEAEYLALAATKPEPAVTQAVSEPAPPKTEEKAARASAGDKPPEMSPKPDLSSPANPETVPEKPDLSAPATEVDATTPAEPRAPRNQLLTALLPPALTKGAPRDVPRVAPMPAPEAPPKAEIAPEFVPPAAPEPAPPETALPEPQKPPQAPEAATTEIVTEAQAKEPEGSRIAALPPRLRPPDLTATAEPRPAETPSPAPESTPEPKPAPKPQAKPEPKPVPAPEPNSSSTSAAIEAALAEASRPDPTPAGPPLSSGEKETLRVAVQQCWNVGSLSSDALRTTVVVSVSMNPDGRPDTGSIRMLSSQGGSDEAARQAYEAARRAIIRCGASGFPLPQDKYAHWAEMEITFDPTKKMQFK